MRFREIINEATITASDIRNFNPGSIEHGVDFFDEDLEKYGIDEMVRWANDIMDSFPEQVPVFRGLSIYGTEDEIVRSIRWNNIGVSWSPDFHHAINEHGSDGGYGRPGHKEDGGAGFTNVVVCGFVAKRDVDWIATFVIEREEGGWDSGEPELRLKSGVTVMIKEVMLLPRSAHDEHGPDSVSPDEAKIVSVSVNATA